MNGEAAVEARRQQALIAALWTRPMDAEALLTQETGVRRERGLAAYRGNADACAERALAAVFPTVAAMLGEEDFVHLAREFRTVHPPSCGDLGEWGGELPAWLQGHAGLADWPWLGDCARLDLARHRCERAADVGLDAESLALLGSDDPAGLHLDLVPGCAVIESPWPIATIFAAHQAHAVDAFDAVQAALQAQRGERVLVARQGWRAAVHEIDEPAARWACALLDGGTVAQAFDAAGEGFDFSAWLGQALQARWVKGVRRISD